MAWITKQEVKEIRENLKKEFPQFKFLLRGSNSSQLRVVVARGPVRFHENAVCDLNHYYPDRYENADILKKIIDVCQRGNYDNSDTQTDYFDVGRYFFYQSG